VQRARNDTSLRPIVDSRIYGPVHLERSYFLNDRNPRRRTAMRIKCGARLKNGAAAIILSGLIAGVICALTAPVNRAVGETTSGNRGANGDRLRKAPIARPVRDNTNSKPNSSKPLLGCEPAFSPYAHPAHAQIFTHCAA